MPPIVVQSGNGGAAGPPGPPGGEVQLFADQFQNPNNADWVVNALAPAQQDTLVPAFTVRAFDDTTEEGVGIPILTRAGVLSLDLVLWHRAQTAPGAPATVNLNLYARTVTSGAPAGAWSAPVPLAPVNVLSTTDWALATFNVTLASLGIAAGSAALLELTRAGTGSLAGDWNLFSLGITLVS